MIDHYEQVSVTLLPMADRRRFQQLNDALTNCTGHYARVLKDADDEICFGLYEGCDDMDGDAFPDLDELALYITNNQDVLHYLQVPGAPQ